MDDQGIERLEVEIDQSAETTEDPVRLKLDHDRRSLLDLSMRNKLLNYRPLRSKGAEIVDEDQAAARRRRAAQAKLARSQLQALSPPPRRLAAREGPPQRRTAAGHESKGA